MELGGRQHELDSNQPLLCLVNLNILQFSLSFICNMERTRLSQRALAKVLAMRRWSARLTIQALSHSPLTCKVLFTVLHSKPHHRAHSSSLPFTSVTVRNWLPISSQIYLPLKVLAKTKYIVDFKNTM